MKKMLLKLGVISVALLPMVAVVQRSGKKIFATWKVPGRPEDDMEYSVTPVKPVSTAIDLFNNLKTQMIEINELKNR